MYSGLDKSGGGLIGYVIKDGAMVDMATAAEEASVEETLVGAGVRKEVCHLQATMNPNDGELSWNSIDVNQSLYKTISMSQMSSMLKDSDRNLIYSKAIEKCIKNFKLKHNGNKSPSVIDIGTGTGLLACLSIHHGAQVVIGCEMFESMAMIANKVIENNKMSDSISIISCKSTELDLGGGKVDILVSELLDSMLLGEACILSHSDAIKRLIVNDDDNNNIVPIEQRIVPNRGKCHMTLVDTCSTVFTAKSQDYHDIKNIFGSNLNDNDDDNDGEEITNVSPFRNDTDADCGGGCQGLPIHWKQFRDYFDAKLLSSAAEVFIVSFTQEVEDVKEVHTTKVTLKVTRDGKLDCILMWWELYLLSTEIDPKGECMYSTEPRDRKETCDEETEGNKQGWQDHWVQVIFPLPAALVCQVKKNDDVVLTVCRDTLHFWIADVKVENLQISRKRCEPEPESKSDMASISSSLLPKACECGWHLLLSPLRILQLNKSYREMERAMKVCTVEIYKRIGCDEIRNNDGVLVDVSDGSRLALMLLRCITNTSSNEAVLQVASIERKQLSRMLHHRTAEAAMKKLQSLNPISKQKPIMMVWDGDDYSHLDMFYHNKDEDVNMDEDERFNLSLAPILALVSDAYYYQLHKMPTWGAIRFMYIRHSFAVKSRLVPKAVISPQLARVMAVAINVPDLWKSYGHVGEVMGFDHGCLDAVQEDWHQYWFPFQLGEYDHKFLTDPVPLLIFDYTSNEIPTTISNEVTTVVNQKDFTFDAVVIWVEYNHDIITNSSSSSSSSHDEDDEDEDKEPQRLSLEKSVLVKFNQKQEEISENEPIRMKYSASFKWGDSDVKVAANLIK